jgi:hypothetical protein
MNPSTPAYRACQRLTLARGNRPSCRQAGRATSAFRRNPRSAPGPEGKVYQETGHCYQGWRGQADRTRLSSAESWRGQTAWGRATLA